MTETPVIASSFTFDPFAQHKFYHDVNQSLVHRAIARLDEAHPKGKPVRVVELASGTGAVTELILDELERLGRPGNVIGVEPSPEAIEIASDRLDSRGARFVQGEADSLVKVAPNADAIFFCNAIHLVPDKRVVARQIASALAPNGFFACNSAFYRERTPPVASASITSGLAARSAGCARTIQASAPRGQRRRWRCSGSPRTNMPRRSNPAGCMWWTAPKRRR